MVLADLGAEVTKVEGPKGDPLHNWNSARDSELWNVLTQKKKMVALDLPAQSGVERLRELVCAGPDLVLASGTPETRRDLSYDHETIRAWAPAVDYCGITGWGDTGDLSEQPATELSVQVAAGMTLHLGEPGHEPIRQGFDLVTMNTGYAAVQAGLSLMLHRMRDSSDRTGEHVEVSMMHTAVALSQWNLAAESCPDEKIGKQLEGYEWEPDHGYVCRDARFYVSFRSDEEAWTRFLIALDRVDLLADSRFSTVKLLRRNERFLPALLVGRLSKWSYSDLERLVRDELGGSIVRIRAPRELPEDPQVAALKFVRPGDSTVPLTMTAPILEVSEL
jgi:crotonobetainyl-CoA:carnitine CoA-transferase CaiB-like acyl-CoA transferase